MFWNIWEADLLTEPDPAALHTAVATIPIGGGRSSSPHCVASGNTPALRDDDLGI